jgi:hypothetical protein
MTAARLIGALGVVDENIFAEAARMAEWFAKAARYRVDQMRRRSRAEIALEEWSATLNLRYRARASHLQERRTEAYFKARITLSPRYKRLLRTKDRADRREELSKLILEAYRMRRDGIKIIAENQTYGALTAERILERSRQKGRLRGAADRLKRKLAGLE